MTEQLTLGLGLYQSRTSIQELARTSSKFLKNPLVIHPSEVLSLKKLVGVYFKINLEANEAF